MEHGNQDGNIMLLIRLIYNLCEVGLHVSQRDLIGGGIPCETLISRCLNQSIEATAREMLVISQGVLSLNTKHHLVLLWKHTHPGIEVRIGFLGKSKKKNMTDIYPDAIPALLKEIENFSPSLKIMNTENS